MEKPPPCSVCRWHRRKSCLQGCMFVTLFPPDDPDFNNMMLLLDCKKLERTILSVEENLRTDLIESLRYEARSRTMNNVHGCVGYIRALEEQNLILRTALSYFYLTAPADVMQQPMNLRPMHTHPHVSMPTHQFGTYGQWPPNIRPTTPWVRHPRAADVTQQALSLRPMHTHPHASMPAQQFGNTYGQWPPNMRPTTQCVYPIAADTRSGPVPGAEFHVPGAVFHPDLTHLSQPGPSAPNMRPTTQCVYPIAADTRSGPVPGAEFHVPGAVFHPDLTHLSQPGPSAPNIRPTIQYVYPIAAIPPDLTHLSQPGPSAPTTQFEFQQELNAPPPNYGQCAPIMSLVQQIHPTSADLRPGPIPDAQQDLSQPGTGQVQAANSGDSSLVPGSGLIDFGVGWNFEEIGSAGGDPGCS